MTPRRTAPRRRGAASRGTRRVGRARDVATRDRLVRAATRRFAEHGFHNVSVREICRDAHANVAAVNYHFGGKLGLYREVVGAAIDAIRRAGEAAILAGDAGTPEDRLRHYVRAFLPAIAGRNPRLDRRDVAWIHKLMRHESSEPTELAPWIAEQALMPRIRYLGGVVAALLRCDPTDPRVKRCVISIQSQCLFYVPDRFRDAAFPGWPPGDDELRAAAEHIVEFSLAGIRQIARERTARRPGDSGIGEDRS